MSAMSDISDAGRKKRIGAAAKSSTQRGPLCRDGWDAITHGPGRPPGAPEPRPAVRVLPRQGRPAPRPGRARPSTPCGSPSRQARRGQPTGIAESRPSDAPTWPLRATAAPVRCLRALPRRTRGLQDEAHLNEAGVPWRQVIAVTRSRRRLDRGVADGSFAPTSAIHTYWHCVAVGVLRTA